MFIASRRRIVQSDGAVTVDARKLLGVTLETITTDGSVKVDAGASADSTKRIATIYLTGSASGAHGSFLPAFPISTDDEDSKFTVSVSGANAIAVVFYSD